MGMPKDVQGGLAISGKFCSCPKAGAALERQVPHHITWALLMRDLCYASPDACLFVVRLARASGLLKQVCSNDCILPQEAYVKIKDGHAPLREAFPARSAMRPGSP